MRGLLVHRAVGFVVAILEAREQAPDPCMVDRHGVRLGLEMALGPDETALFEQWRNGAEAGFFFLDSVDEARLNRKSFEIALKRFARELGASLDRTHVFISCRVSDWKEPGDRRSIETLLPLPREPAAAEVPENPLAP